MVKKFVATIVISGGTLCTGYIITQIFRGSSDPSTLLLKMGLAMIPGILGMIVGGLILSTVKDQ